MASTKTVVEVPSRVEDGRTAVPSAHALLKWVYWGRVTVAVGIFVAAALSFNVVSAGIIVVLSVAALLSVGVSGASVWYTHIRRCTPGRTFLYGQALFDLKAMISGGVVCSLPSQNAQKPPFFGETRIPKSEGRFPLSIEIMTHLPEMGSFLSSGIKTSQKEYVRF